MVRKMALTVIRPTSGEKAYAIAAEAFCELCEKVTGTRPMLSDRDDEQNDLVVIGSDSVNDFLMNEMFEGRLTSLGIRYGTDDYCIKSYRKDDRSVLVLAGGRGRSTVYAVYDYFERFADCGYFWDGDVIGQRESLPMRDISVHESPRFEYRGLRYFAHRGLHRFQAEHWNFDDWKREIDFLMKKRLNFFMLRIGMDDAWQRAFPDIVPYPDGYRHVTDEKGYDDRSDFWTLAYRGKLREKVMTYARDNDLMSPTDCGTMTHWYSRTPKEFLAAKKPAFLEQADRQYNEFATGKVFDFRCDENMKYYMHLTDTMAQQYDCNNALFHTIGLGERRMYDDDTKNFRLKQFCYRRIAQNIREKYPNSKLFVASWDFVGWWSPEEVQNLTRELDPERTIILDYTSEGSDEEQNFTRWGVVGKFPWIFGLFHAYEPESELRGPYERIAERLKVAAEDPYCKGMILWPELSHSDPIVLEYLSENAWAPLTRSPEDMLTDFCKKRYGELSGTMNSIWQSFFPFMKLGHWGGYKREKRADGKFRTDIMWEIHTDLWTKPLGALDSASKSENDRAHFEQTLPKALDESGNLVKLIEALADINETDRGLFVRRDSIDIVRTVAGRMLNYVLAACLYDQNGAFSRIDLLEKHYARILELLGDLCRHGEDFSLYESLRTLEASAPTNPDFEHTLKQNIVNEYCRQYCTELIDEIFTRETPLAFTWLRKRDELAPYREKAAQIEADFMQKPLADMQKASTDSLSTVMRKLAEQIAYTAYALKQPTE